MLDIQLLKYNMELTIDISIAINRMIFCFNVSRSFSLSSQIIGEPQ